MLKIVTDSAANLTAEQAKEAGVEVLPYPVIFGNETLLDGVTLTVDGFYERLVTDPAHPHTSQIPRCRERRTAQGSPRAISDVRTFTSMTRSARR